MPDEQEVWNRWDIFISAGGGIYVEYVWMFNLYGDHFWFCYQGSYFKDKSRLSKLTVLMMMGRSGRDSLSLCVQLGK